MYREALRRCPACDGAMAKVPLSVDGGEVVVDRCAGCRGAYFDFFDGIPSTLSRALSARELGADPAGPPVVSALCPVCRVPMEEHRDYAQVFYCRGCLGVFIGSAALRTVAQVYLVLDPPDSPSFLERIVAIFRPPRSH